MALTPGWGATDLNEADWFTHHIAVDAMSDGPAGIPANSHVRHHQSMTCNGALEAVATWPVTTVAVAVVTPEGVVSRIGPEDVPAVGIGDQA
jgi:hypothetical protein